jgi:hypothetical protein
MMNEKYTITNMNHQATVMHTIRTGMHAMVCNDISISKISRFKVEIPEAHYAPFPFIKSALQASLAKLTLSIISLATGTDRSHTISEPCRPAW